MLIALIDGQRVSAAPRLKGLCPGCQQPGQQRAWHWAHDSKMECDSWWEETAWHRFWKSHFPLEWQEVILFDAQTGEKHIADVRTRHGLVMEFQHSPLDQQELVAREAFYKNMVWIVDASHRKNDYKRFIKGFPQFRQTPSKGVFLVATPEKCFPTNWIHSTKPVFFDFRGIEPSAPPDNGRELLWCILPGRIEGFTVLVAFNRGDLVGETTENSDLIEVLQGLYGRVRNFLIPPRPVARRLPPPSRPYYGQRRYRSRRL